MPRPVEGALVRARTHVAQGRLNEAVGAYRAVLAIEPERLDAQLELAATRVALGDLTGAVDELLLMASEHVEAERHVEAMSAFGRALGLDPSRSEIHLDVAFVESAMGRHDAAVSRIEALADGYMNAGRTEEAAELLRFLSTWADADDERATLIPTRTETVVCATVLIRPDGTLLMPTGDAAAAPERTVRRAVSGPIVLDELDAEDLDAIEIEPDPDGTTKILVVPPPPRASEIPTVPRTDPQPLAASPGQRTIPFGLPMGPANRRSARRPSVASPSSATPTKARTDEGGRATPKRVAKFRLERAPRPGAPRSAAADSKPRPAAPTATVKPSPKRGTVMVARPPTMRAKAPRHVVARPTEPISTRLPLALRSEDESTRRLRHPGRRVRQS